MSDLMEFKGYYGSASYSDKDIVFHGKLEFIRDLVTFEGADMKSLKQALSLKQAFEESVEDYLKDCKSRNQPSAMTPAPWTKCR